MSKCSIISVLLSLALFISVENSNAQTSFSVSNKTNGDTLLTIDNNGRLGIGTTAPASTIDARSATAESGPSLNLSNFDGSHYLYLYSGRSGASALSPVMIWQEGDPMRFASWGTQYNEYMRISETGNIGIGIMHPAARLDVSGAMCLSGAATLPDQTNYYLYMAGYLGGVDIGKIYVGDNTGWRFHFSSRIDGTDTDLMTIIDNGHVGIGTTDPSELLEVNGTVYSTSGGFRFPDGSLQSTAATTGESVWEGDPDISYTAGDVGIGTTAPLTRLHVEQLDLSLGAAALYNELLTIESSDAGLGLYSSNDGSYGSAFSMGEIVSGALTNKWSIYRTTSGASPANQLRFSYGSNPGYHLNPTLWSLSANGNVGIGTTAPTQRLQVAGTIYSSSGGFRFPDGTTQTTAATGGGDGNTLDEAYDQGGAGAGRIITADAGAVNIAGTGGLTVNANVGIGTTLQNYPLTIVPGNNLTGLYIDHDPTVADQTRSLVVDLDKSSTGDAHIYSGVFSATNDNGTGTTRSLYAVADGTSSGLKIGMAGTAQGAGDNCGVVGSASGSANQYGVYGYASGTGTLWAGYFTSGNVHIQNRLGIGTTTPASALDVRGNVTVRDETSGSVVIELGTGLDYAEGFDVSDDVDIVPGTVLCIDADHPGHLKISDRCYDHRVAGIVAGANRLGSGITLGSGDHDFNVALAGRVYCNADASMEAIEAGDLLTTSDRPGYARKVTDYNRSNGAILGKAMENLEKGKQGQILVLVTLQ